MQARDTLTVLGPFFAAEAHDPRTPPAAPWRAMGELLDEPAVLAARVETNREYLAAAGGLPPEAVERRVAASVTHLGLAARVLSPLLALAVLYGDFRSVRLRDLRWQSAVPSTFPLSIADLDAVGRALRADAPPEVIAREFAEAAVETVAAELCAAMRVFGVSDKVLWGNTASAVNGACATLRAARPDHASRLQVVLAHLLRRGALDGTAQRSLDDRFQRRSCCLIYRAAPDRDGVVCGDCVLIGTRRTARGGAPR